MFLIVNICLCLLYRALSVGGLINKESVVLTVNETHSNEIQLVCEISKEAFTATASIFLHCPVSSTTCYENCQYICSDETKCAETRHIPEVACTEEITHNKYHRFIYHFNGTPGTKFRGDWYCKWKNFKSDVFKLVPEKYRKAFTTSVSSVKPVELKRNNQTTSTLSQEILRPEHDNSAESIQTNFESSASGNLLGGAFILTRWELMLIIIIALSASVFVNLICCIRCMLFRKLFDMQKSNKKDSSCLQKCLCLSKGTNFASYPQNNNHRPTDFHLNHPSNKENPRCISVSSDQSYLLTEIDPYSINSGTCHPPTFGDGITPLASSQEGIIQSVHGVNTGRYYRNTNGPPPYAFLTNHTACNLRTANQRHSESKSSVYDEVPYAIVTGRKALLQASTSTSAIYAKPYRNSASKSYTSNISANTAATVRSRQQPPIAPRHNSLRRRESNDDDNNIDLQASSSCRPLPLNSDAAMETNELIMQHNVALGSGSITATGTADQMSLEEGGSSQRSSEILEKFSHSNSRLELSKKMIAKADTLLREAGSLLRVDDSNR